MDTTSGAVSQTYDSLQDETLNAAATKVASAIEILASEQHLTHLAQLASKISAVLRFGGQNSDDVFAKVKGLINDMIAKLLAKVKTEPQ